MLYEDNLFSLCRFHRTNLRSRLCMTAKGQQNGWKQTSICSQIIWSCPMGAEELAEAAQQYARLWVEEESVDMDDQKREGMLEPFKLLFKTEDMWTFCEEMSDKQGSSLFGTTVVNVLNKGQLIV